MAKSKVKKPKISIVTVHKKALDSLFNPKPSPALLDFVSKDTLLTNTIKEEEARTMGIRKDTFETKMFMTDGNGRVLSRSEEKKVFEDAEQMYYYLSQEYIK